MQDDFSYCADLVRAADRDRFLAALFAPAEHRGALHALQAFDIEVARVREAAREPLAGEVRLQWWREVILGERTAEARGNPVAAALLATIKRYGFDTVGLLDLIEARRFDVYDEPMATLADLEAYAAKTHSALLALAAQILIGAESPPAAQPMGIALAIAGLLQAFPRHAARRQLYVPLEILERHRVEPEQVFAGVSSEGLKAALAELRQFASGHLRSARASLAMLPREAVPALLPVAPVQRQLDRLSLSDPFAPAGLSPWRRQWLIWRAARRPARIAT